MNHKIVIMASPFACPRLAEAAPALERAVPARSSSSPASASCASSLALARLVRLERALRVGAPLIAGTIDHRLRVEAAARRWAAVDARHAGRSERAHAHLRVHRV